MLPESQQQLLQDLIMNGLRQLQQEGKLASVESTVSGTGVVQGGHPSALFASLVEMDMHTSGTDALGTAPESIPVFEADSDPGHRSKEKSFSDCVQGSGCVCGSDSFG